MQRVEKVLPLIFGWVRAEKPLQPVTSGVWVGDNWAAGAALPPIPRMQLALSDIGLIELNEAFAVQALAVIRESGLDPAIVNVNGGAVALGHPLGCTGAKLTATILREMRRRAVRFGMVTMCIGGGQARGIFERIEN